MEVYRKLKKRIRLLLLATVIIGISCIPGRLSVLATKTETELDSVRDDIDQLEEEQEKNKQDLKELESDKAYLDGKLAELNSQLSAAAQELTSLQEQLAAKGDAIRRNMQQLENARQEEEKQYINMKKRIRFLYERGETSMLEAILKAGSFADFINLSEYAESIYSYDREMLVQYCSVREEISAREEQLEKEQQELTALAEQQEEKQARVRTLLAEVQTSIDSTSQQITNTENNIAANEALLEQQKAYEAELEVKKAAEDALRMEEIKKQESENMGSSFISDSENDIAMLAALIECEAGGESYEGKLAVGSVVINRIRSSYFPNTLVEVIYAPGQFSPVASGRFATVLSRGASASCVQAARENLSGTLTVNSLYFRRNTGTINGIVIGNHVFY